MINNLFKQFSNSDEPEPRKDSGFHVLGIEKEPGTSLALREKFASVFEPADVRWESVSLEGAEGPLGAHLPGDHFDVVVLSCDEGDPIFPDLRDWLRSWSEGTSGNDRDLLLICRLQCREDGNPMACPWRQLLSEIEATGNVEVVWGVGMGSGEGDRKKSVLLTTW